MVNTLFFQLIIIVQTMSCQVLNNLCLCSTCSIFVLQSQLTEFSASLRQQQSDNTSQLVSHQKRGLEQRQLQNICPPFLWKNQGNFRVYLFLEIAMPSQVKNCMCSRSFRHWINLYTVYASSKVSCKDHA